MQTGWAMNFDDTYTDKEFESAFRDANADLFASGRPSEPDLQVQGLNGSLMSKLLALFGRDA
jgi:hypothetical protein